MTWMSMRPAPRSSAALAASRSSSPTVRGPPPTKTRLLIGRAVDHRRAVDRLVVAHGDGRRRRAGPAAERIRRSASAPLPVRCRTPRLSAAWPVRARPAGAPLRCRPRSVAPLGESGARHELLGEGQRADGLRVGVRVEPRGVTGGQVQVAGLGLPRSGGQVDAVGTRARPRLLRVRPSPAGPGHAAGAECEVQTRFTSAVSAS